VIAGFVPILGGSAASEQGAQLGVTLATLLVEAGEACIPGGPVQGLDQEQASDAEQVVSAAFADSGENQSVARIALMVAWTESTLQDLGPMAGNAGSIGLFQQRGWGTEQQELDPTTATALFVNRLLGVSEWQQLPPWVAAQDVQRSAFADGSNYEANWVLSGQLLTQVLSNGDQPGACGQGVPNGLAGPASAHGLPVGYSVPAGTGPAHAEVVTWALAQLGKPYVWAAAGPSSFDCSGLTMAAWATAGVHLVHYTVSQQEEGVAVSPAQLMAGDLVLIPGSDSPGPGEAGHVGIYLGAGLVESAIDPQMGVAVQSWQTFIGGGLIALRDPDPTDG
jgi:peptidoglycan DL-endopeptidase CwlO